MKISATFMTIFVALAHFVFMVLEIFFWQHPIGRSIFSMTAAQAAETAILAANQGLYNGFLAAGLIWGLASRKQDVVTFFLCCVVVAGIFGGFTASASIFVVQAMPGAIAICARYCAREMRE